MDDKKFLNIHLKRLSKSKNAKSELGYTFFNNNERIITSDILLYEIIKDLKQYSNSGYQLYINSDQKISDSQKENLDRIQNVFNRFRNNDYPLDKFSENLKWLEIQREKAIKEIENEAKQSRNSLNGVDE